MTTLTNLPDREADRRLERQLLENVQTLMHRDRISGRELGRRLDITRGKIETRLAGTTSFLYVEVRAIADYFGVTLEEIEGTLPPFAEWEERVKDLRACRDSNPKPSDWEPRLILGGGFFVKSALTLDRPVAQRLRAVS